METDFELRFEPPGSNIKAALLPGKRWMCVEVEAPLGLVGTTMRVGVGRHGALPTLYCNVPLEEDGDMMSTGCGNVFFERNTGVSMGPLTVKQLLRACDGDDPL